MTLRTEDFEQDIWALDKKGKKVHPYKGERGDKKGLYSVNFTNDTNNYKGCSGEQIVEWILKGKFSRGTIRMMPLDYTSDTKRNAYAPKYYKGKPIKDFL